MKLFLKVFQVSFFAFAMGISLPAWALPIRVTSSPAGASVIIDGKRTYQKTPTFFRGLEEGKNYRISLQKRGFETYETEVRIDAKKGRIHADLIPLKPSKENKKHARSEDGHSIEKALGYGKIYRKGTYGWLEVRTLPPGATVYIDGERQGGSTPNRYKVLVGVKQVSVVIPGKTKRDFSRVKIKPGQITDLGKIDFRDDSPIR